MGIFAKIKRAARNMRMMMSNYGMVVENIQNVNAMLDGYNNVVENVRNTNAMTANYHALEENIRALNQIADSTKNVLKMQQAKLTVLEKRGSGAAQPIVPTVKEVASTNNPVDTYSKIDYFDFENHFRGSEELITERQRQYIPYFAGKKNVVDLGCGRGEFLRLCKENGIEAKGVDLYEEFVELGKINDLSVTRGDALQYLREQEKLGGIFAAQLIEHLSIDHVVELCELAYEKLEDGACVILETPNPMCLAIYTNSFYVDPSHNKPVHPLTMQYIMEKAGFTDIQILYTKESRVSDGIPILAGVQNANAFNEAMQAVSESLFGSQDYAIIARKC